MLQQTFVHIPGVGRSSEVRLWSQGCLFWSDWLNSPEKFRTAVPKSEFRAGVERSIQALEAGEHQYFAPLLREREAWRALPEFKSKTVYLDIETDGGSDGDAITIIGAFDGTTFTAFIRGENLEQFRDYLSGFSMVVTFFGTGFDLPIIRRRFPHLGMDQIHVDLCPALRQVGITGGLKRIEHQLGIERSAATRGLTGLDAVRLWRQAQRGYASAMDTLIAYNREDTVNLALLADHAYRSLRAQAFEPLAEPATRRKAPRVRSTP